MKPIALLLALTGIGCLSAPAADEVIFQSGTNQTALIELFTSEGCSSCPPAEAWLSKLASEPGLWKDFVPVAFHVDYWDSRGWKDRFASPTYTQRQRAYAATWRSGSVYTPAFAVNGREAKSPLLGSSAKNAGELKVTRNSNQLTISYAPSGEWEAHVALLSSGVRTKVGGGENSGKDLRHDFVVVSYERIPMTKAQAGYRLPTAEGGSRKALAVWVTPRGQLAPVQATGGWLSGP